MEGTERKEVLYTGKQLCYDLQGGPVSAGKHNHPVKVVFEPARPRRFSLGKHMEDTKLPPGTACHMISPNSEGYGQIGRAWRRCPTRAISTTVRCISDPSDHHSRAI
jgi:hypothetical protein